MTTVSRPGREVLARLKLSSILLFAGAAMLLPVAAPAVVPCNQQFSEFPRNPQRTNHVAIYDPATDRMVVFGGDSDLGLSRKVTAQNFTGDPFWTEIATAGVVVPYVSGHAGVFDPVRHRLITIGGMSTTLQSGAWALTLTGTPTWSALNPTGTGPGPIRWHTATYDPLGDRVIVFGGNNGSSNLNGTWTLSLSGTPAWRALVTSGTPPAARKEHTAIYDPVGHRMIVYGGADDLNTALSDVWALNLDSNAWTELVPDGPIPPGRSSHSAVYDPEAHAMAIFGGVASGLGVSNDVWTLALGGTPVWTELSPFRYSSVQRRFGHTAIYDSLRNRMVVCGGRQQNNFFVDQETWACPLEVDLSWTLITRAVPAPRSGHTSIYDPVADRMIVFGGEGGGSRRNDLWLARFGTSSLLPAEWQYLSVLPNAPSARVDATANYDGAARRMIVFGGDDGSLRNDTWSLSLDSLGWSEIVPAGDPPPPRSNHAAVFVPSNRRLIVFGGYNGTFPGDLWSLDLNGSPVWEELYPLRGGPTGRAGHTLVYDSFRNRVLLFGGYGAAGYRNDVWALSLTGDPRWSQITPSGTPPSPRAWHTAIYDPIRDRIVMYGGYDGSASLWDMWELSLSGTPTWTRFGCGNSVLQYRQKHTAVYDLTHDRMIAFGGVNETTFDQPSNSCDIVMWGQVSGAPEELSVGLQPPFRLLACYPNPSTARIVMPFVLEAPDRITAGIFDLQGRLVHLLFRERLVDAGTHEVAWDGRNDAGRPVPAGLYFYRFATATGVQSRRVVLIR